MDNKQNYTSEEWVQYLEKHCRFLEKMNESLSTDKRLLQENFDSSAIAGKMLLDEHQLLVKKCGEAEKTNKELRDHVARLQKEIDYVKKYYPAYGDHDS